MNRQREHSVLGTSTLGGKTGEPTKGNTTPGSRPAPILDLRYNTIQYVFIHPLDLQDSRDAQPPFLSFSL